MTSLGDELLADPGVETQWTGQLNDSWHNDGSVTVVKSASAHTGSYAQQVQLSNPPGSSADLWTGATTTVGNWYRAGFWAKRTTGSAEDVFAWLNAPGGDVSYWNLPITGDNYTQYVYTAQASATELHLGVTNGLSTSSSDTVVIDDASIRQVPFASMVSLQDGKNSSGKAVAYLTIQAGTQAGIVFCADSAADPQNYLLVYHDGSRINFFKVISGSYTSLPSGDDIPYYNVSTNHAVEYVPGAPLLVQRVSGTNDFIVSYNGHYVWTQTVTDPAIISNTIHGAFSSYEGNQVNLTYSSAKITKNVVFFGGSITNGAGASEQKYGWQYLLRDHLDFVYSGIIWSYVNASAGGTDSFYSLMRLQADVLAHAPDIVLVDEAVNDGELDPSNPEWPYVGEAIVRGIRTAFPEAKIIVTNFIRPVGSDAFPDANTEKLRTAWNLIAGYYKCDLYRLDTALLGILPANPTSAQIDAYFIGPSDVHPNDAGHQLIFTGLSSLISPLSANAWTGNLADYPRLGLYTEYYEATPVTIQGAELLTRHLTTGSWDQTATGAITTAFPGSTITYTGPMVMAGLDVALQNGYWPVGLQYSLDGGAWTSVIPQNGFVSNSEILFTSGPMTVHTLLIKLNSGTVSINRLLIL